MKKKQFDESLKTLLNAKPINKMKTTIKMPPEIAKDMIGKLYRHLNKAKSLQLDIVSIGGESIKKETRQEIVNVWNSLDSALTATFKAIQLEGINYNHYIK